jgi:hypothetical protein
MKRATSVVARSCSRLLSEVVPVARAGSSSGRYVGVAQRAQLSSNAGVPTRTAGAWAVVVDGYAHSVAVKSANRYLSSMVSDETHTLLNPEQIQLVWMRCAIYV